MANPYPADVERQLMADPEFARLLQQARASKGGFRNLGQTASEATALRDRARALGVEVPHDYLFNTGGDDQNQVFDKQSFLNRNEWLPKAAAIGTMGLVGGLAAAPLLAGGGGAAAGGGATAAGGGGTAAATTAAGGGMGGWNIAKKALGIGGDIASNALSGRAEGRAAEADYGLDRDRIALDRASLENRDKLAAGQLDMNQRTTGSNLDDSRLAQAIKLGLLGGMGDVEMEFSDELKPYIPKITGGARPSAIQGREEIVSAMRPRIMEKLMTGEQFKPLDLTKMPELTEAPRPNGVDKALEIGGWAGLAGDLWNEFRPSSGASKPNPTYSNVVPPGVVRNSGVRFG